VNRVLLAVLVLAGCATPPTPMRVLVQPPAYKVEMTTTRGLGMTPITEAPPGMKVRYIWKTDGGYFLTQNDRTTEIIDLGPETVNEGAKLYWTYEPGEQSALAERPVAISIKTENVKTGKEIAWADFTLVWDGEFFRAKH